MKRWFAVLGDPIGHSMSPFMHNHWFTELGIDATYIPIQVTKENLPQAVEGLKTLGASGWNVTIPHKTAIIPLLDELDEMAQRMSAVNTVVRKPDGKLKGYNTDGIGFVQSLEEAIGTKRKESSILLIGAGGAARGIAFALFQKGYSNLTITNRTMENARSFSQDLEHSDYVSFQEAEQRLEQFDMLIQTTPAGMKNGQFELPFGLDRLSDTSVVADIVYNPLMTPFLQAAKDKGVLTVNGLGMFVHQGSQAFEYWLGEKPNTKTMIDILTKQLGGSYVNR